jgi:hypothetical protein
LAALHWGLKKKVEHNATLKWITIITKLILAFVGVGALMAFLSFIPTQMFYTLSYGLHTYAFLIGIAIAFLSFIAAIVAYEREEEKNIKKFVTKHPFLLTMILIGLGGSAALIVSHQMPTDITMNDSVKYMGIGFCFLIGGVVIKDILYILETYVFNRKPNNDESEQDNRNFETKYKTIQKVGTVLTLSASISLTVGCGIAAIVLYMENTGFLNQAQSHSMYALFVTAAVVTILRVGILNCINNQEKGSVILNENVEHQNANINEGDDSHDDAEKCGCLPWFSK